MEKVDPLIRKSEKLFKTLSKVDKRWKQSGHSAGPQKSILTDTISEWHSPNAISKLKTETTDSLRSTGNFEERHNLTGRVSSWITFKQFV